MVAGHKPLNDLYLPVYNTEEGKRAYRETLDTVTNRYPQYVQEIQGTADGAKVPFYKLFLLHMDDILPNVVNQTNNPETHGCSSVMSNFPNSELLGHNEDALAVTLNRVYIVNATILEGEKVVEKFCSYCYAGYLPGFCMSYNSHGLVYTVNIISAKNLARAKTPRSILTRALLRCRSLRCVEDVLRDCGAGAADAVSINLTFLDQEGDRLFHNIEVAPPSPSSPQESNMSVLTLSPGEYGYHFNR
ncbi:hypothetical protein AAG570_004812 [Ranatra chinensis]|uniref:Peptidase C45 hydrolase domain-containing protein n=1 Tax=Ranatra chinensis TaxID=642074 RepID=A0ABD0Y1X4_9HEMI